MTHPTAHETKATNQEEGGENADQGRENTKEGIRSASKSAAFGANGAKTSPPHRGKKSATADGPGEVSEDLSKQESWDKKNASKKGQKAHEGREGRVQGNAVTAGVRVRKEKPGKQPRVQQHERFQWRGALQRSAPCPSGGAAGRQSADEGRTRPLRKPRTGRAGQAEQTESKHQRQGSVGHTAQHRQPKRGNKHETPGRVAMHPEQKA